MVKIGAGNQSKGVETLQNNTKAGEDSRCGDDAVVRRAEVAGKDGDEGKESEAVDHAPGKIDPRCLQEADRLESFQIASRRAGRGQCNYNAGPDTRRPARFKAGMGMGWLRSFASTDPAGIAPCFLGRAQ